MSNCRKVLDAIDHKVIKTKITSPCRKAEHTYTPKYLFPQNYLQFEEDCGLFWNHLTRSFIAPNANIKSEFALGFARQNIERAFHHIGGMQYAFSKAQAESFGYVKNVITNIFIDEMIEKYIDSVLHTYVNPLNYEEISELMREYVESFNVVIESRGEFQRMIANYEIILKSHAKRHEELDLDREVGAITRG